MIEIKYGKRKVVSYRGNQQVVGGLTAKNKIDVLLYTSTDLANSNNQGELFDLVLRLSEEIFEVDNVTLRLWDGEWLRPVRYLTETDPPRRPLRSGEGFSGKVLQEGEPALISDLSGHPELLDEGETTRCVCCVPIMYRDSALGTISIEKDVGGFYKKDDLEIVEAMASQLGLALNEVRLVEGLIEAQDRINNDLRMGRIVQSQIVSQNIPPWNGLSFGVLYEPMVEVSGDYFDVVRHGNALTMLIADVSGHGVSAALVTVTIHHEFRRCVDQGMGLPEMIEALGESIRPKLPLETYFTAQVVRLYPDLTYSFVNAGHNRMLVYRAATRTFEEEELGGIPLGIATTRREDYPEQFGKLDPADMLIMYTDGLTEQRNADHEETGLNRTMYWFYETAGMGTAATVLGETMQRWRAHVGSVPRSDDLTLLIARHEPRAVKAREVIRAARKALRQGDSDQAIALAEQAYEIDRGMAENLLLMARLYYRAGQHRRAAERMESYREQTGELSAQHSFVLGNMYYRSGMNVEAKREFKRALLRDHGYAGASLMLARTYLKEGARAKALRTLEQAARTSPGSERVRLALARVKELQRPARESRHG